MSTVPNKQIVTTAFDQAENTTASKNKESETSARKDAKKGRRELMEKKMKSE